MRPIAGTITDPADDQLPNTAPLKPLDDDDVTLIQPRRPRRPSKETIRRARAYGESPAQVRARINGFRKD